MKELVQIFLQLKEVDGCDEAFVGFGQAVSGQLHDLVVDEAEDAVGQRKNVLRRVRVDELGQPSLHLCCGLACVWRGCRWWYGVRRGHGKEMQKKWY